MHERVEKALELHHQGMNCAQCVAMAFADALGLDPMTVKDMMIGFGIGGGNSKGTCGALAGALFINGMLVRRDYPDEDNPKDQVYASNEALIDDFEQKVGGVLCREIAGLDTGVILKSCDACIQIAAERLREGFLI